MRISDWSSDVCSSDLAKAATAVVARRSNHAEQRVDPQPLEARADIIVAKREEGDAQPQFGLERRRHEIGFDPAVGVRSEEHTSELQSLMRISYAVFCLKKKTTHTTILLPTITVHK